MILPARCSSSGSPPGTAKRSSTPSRRSSRGLADTIAVGTAARDLGGSAPTTEFTAAVIKAIGAGRVFGTPDDTTALPADCDAAPLPGGGRAAVLVGRCSARTLEQIARARATGLPSLRLDVLAAAGRDVTGEAPAWYEERDPALPVLIQASASPVPPWNRPPTRPRNWRRPPSSTFSCGDTPPVPSPPSRPPRSRPRPPDGRMNRERGSHPAKKEHMMVAPVPTADLVDRYGTELRVCDLQLRQFGAHRGFAGPVRTVSCHEDNGLLRDLLRTPGDGAVLVVDGGGSLRTALVGDLIAGAAQDNGWAGLVLRRGPRQRSPFPVSGSASRHWAPSPARAPRGRPEPSTSPSPFGGVTFRPGDILHADDDGIVLLPDQT